MAQIPLFLPLRLTAVAKAFAVGVPILRKLHGSGLFTPAKGVAARRPFCCYSAAPDALPEVSHATGSYGTRAA
ncbi:MAG: hypothetical protein WC383_13350, partial [Gammaproteobacteria bacterium]